MGFSDAVSTMFALYGDHDYEGALRVVRDMRTTYPEESNRVTFWEACLLSRTGRYNEAIQTLARGLHRGEWWPPGRLEDEDLDPIRTAPDFKQIVERCREITRQKMAERPGPIVRPDRGLGTILVIQGAHANQREVASIWHDAAPSGWGVVTPAGAEPSPEGGWSWPHSVQSSVRSVVGDIEDVELSEPLILNGFSIGVAIASHMINAADLAVHGLIAIAPSSPQLSDFAELIEATRELPTLIIAGDRDGRADRFHSLKRELSARSNVDFQLIPGLGHANPHDLNERVQGYLKGFE